MKTLSPLFQWLEQKVGNRHIEKMPSVNKHKSNQETLPYTISTIKWKILTTNEESNPKTPQKRKQNGPILGSFE